MSSQQQAASSWGNLPSITGGIPTTTDTAPSIIFAILYLLTLGAVIVRLIMPTYRTWLLARLIAFLGLQVAGGILHAIISRGNYSTNLFIGDQICTFCGFVAICEPVVVIFHRGLNRFSTHRFFFQLSLLLHMGLTAAVVLGIVGATMINSNITPSQLSTIYTMREAGAGLIIGIIGVCALGFIGLRIAGIYALSQILPMLFSSAMILIVSAYKLSTAINPTDPFSNGTKAGYYCLLALPQLLACLPFIIYNLNTKWPPKSTDDKLDHADKGAAFVRPVVVHSDSIDSTEHKAPV